MPYFDGDGNELNPDLISKPHLCVGCAKDEIEDEDETVLCNLTRLDQSEEKEFICYGFEPKKV
jgi:hypothetical protein